MPAANQIALIVGAVVVIVGLLVWAVKPPTPDSATKIQLPGGFEITVNAPALGDGARNCSRLSGADVFNRPAALSFKLRDRASCSYDNPTRGTHNHRAAARDVYSDDYPATGSRGHCAPARSAKATARIQGLYG
jgi:hypothetical protein